MNLHGYTLAKQAEETSQAMLTSAAQLRADLMFQSFYDLVADGGGFGVGHRFIGLIGETIGE